MASPRLLDPIVQRPATRTVDRVTRSPKTPFSLVTVPWDLTPMCLFPVLPGETMTNCFMQGQFWTDPLKAGLKNTPWTFEAWFWYVKFRDLPGWETAADGIGRDLIQMIEVGEDLSPNRSGAYGPGSGTAKNGINYVSFALQRIAECYFREEGQAWNVVATASGLPVTHAFPGRARTWADRLSLAAAAEDRRVNWPTHVGGEVSQAYMDYAASRNQSAAELQVMDYEDIVRAAGGRVVVRHEEREDMHVPELLGQVRHFDYPVNTVEATTGVPAVAFGHRIKGVELKQNFRFPEFGWVLGACCWRPKSFMKNQQGLMASMMQTRSHWFMPNEDPNSDSHWITMPVAEGPLSALMTPGALPYTVDLRNLLWHGEQFTNWDPAGTALDAVVSLPTAAGAVDYPSQADQVAVFAGAAGSQSVRFNGVVDVNILTYPVTNPDLTQDDRQFSNRD